ARDRVGRAADRGVPVVGEVPAGDPRGGGGRGQRVVTGDRGAAVVVGDHLHQLELGGVVGVGDGAGHGGPERHGDGGAGPVDGAPGRAGPHARGRVAGAGVGNLGQVVALAREHVVGGA